MGHPARATQGGLAAQRQSAEPMADCALRRESALPAVPPARSAEFRLLRGEFFVGGPEARQSLPLLGHDLRGSPFDEAPIGELGAGLGDLAFHPGHFAR